MHSKLQQMFLNESMYQTCNKYMYIFFVSGDIFCTQQFDPKGMTNNDPLFPQNSKTWSKILEKKMLIPVVCW